MTSAGIPYWVIALGVWGLIMVALGPLVDSLNDVNIELAQDPQIPMSQDRANAWNFAMIAWYCLAFVLLFGSIIWAIIEFVAWHSGEAY